MSPLPKNSFWKLAGKQDHVRRINLPANTIMMFVKHCPGIYANLDRTALPHIEHDCIDVWRGHAIIVVGEQMLQVSYGIVRRIVSITQR